MIDRHRVRTEISVDPVRGQRQVVVGGLLVVGDIDGGQPVGDITFVPFDQQLFLVGAAADADPLARQRLPVGVGPVVVLRHLQRDIVEPVGGEVVLLLALLGHGDIGDERVHLTGIDLHEILRPVGSEGFEAQPEDIGDQIGEIDLGADQCPVVGGMEPQRRSGGGRTRDHEGARSRMACDTFAAMASTLSVRTRVDCSGERSKTCPSAVRTSLPTSPPLPQAAVTSATVARTAASIPHRRPVRAEPMMFP